MQLYELGIQRWQYSVTDQLQKHEVAHSIRVWSPQNHGEPNVLLHGLLFRLLLRLVRRVGALLKLVLGRIAARGQSSNLTARLSLYSRCLCLCASAISAPICFMTQIILSVFATQRVAANDKAGQGTPWHRCFNLTRLHSRKWSRNTWSW